MCPDDINEDSLLLFSMFDPRLDIVIVGCGDLENVDAVRNRCMPAFRKWKVPVEFMATVRVLCLPSSLMTVKIPTGGCGANI